jgi:SAM-dependent methyltransferase
MEAAPEQVTTIKLDLGCGPRKQAGFIGVDTIKFDGVDEVADLRESWPWADNSVDEVHSSHFVEHLDAKERVHFFNELYRVLKPGASARIVTPHWSHERALGDPSHKWPPVCGWTYFYLEKSWRESNAPHVSGPGWYECDFSYTLAGSHDPNDAYVAFRNLETKMVMMQRNINTTTDLIAVITKK